MPYERFWCSRRTKRSLKRRKKRKLKLRKKRRRSDFEQSFGALRMNWDRVNRMRRRLKPQRRPKPRRKRPHSTA